MDAYGDARLFDLFESKNCDCIENPNEKLGFLISSFLAQFFQGFKVDLLVLKWFHQVFM